MPWCPKCGAEYREGFSECADCRVSLVSSPPETDSAEEAREHLIDPVVVYQVATTAEACIICETLRNADISCVMRDSSLGGILKTYTGSSIFGTDIVVDRARLEDARELLQIWSAQDVHAPISEEELARLALTEVSEEELSAQAEAEAPAALVGNHSDRLMKVVLGALAALAILLLLVSKLTL